MPQEAATTEKEKFVKRIFDCLVSSVLLHRSLAYLEVEQAWFDDNDPMLLGEALKKAGFSSLVTFVQQFPNELTIHRDGVLMPGPFPPKLIRDNMRMIRETRGSFKKPNPYNTNNGIMHYTVKARLQRLQYENEGRTSDSHKSPLILYGGNHRHSTQSVARSLSSYRRVPANGHGSFTQRGSGYGSGKTNYFGATSFRIDSTFGRAQSIPPSLARNYVQPSTFGCYHLQTMRPLPSWYTEPDPPRATPFNFNLNGTDLNRNSGTSPPSFVRHTPGLRSSATLSEPGTLARYCGMPPPDVVQDDEADYSGDSDKSDDFVPAPTSKVMLATAERKEVQGTSVAVKENSVRLSTPISATVSPVSRRRMLVSSIRTGTLAPTESKDSQTSCSSGRFTTSLSHAVMVNGMGAVQHIQAAVKTTFDDLKTLAGVSGDLDYSKMAARTTDPPSPIFAARMRAYRARAVANTKA